VKQRFSFSLYFFLFSLDMLVFTHLAVACAVDRQECVHSMLLAVVRASLASTVLDKPATWAGGMADGPAGALADGPDGSMADAMDGGRRGS